MSHPPARLGQPPHHATVALGLITVATALAIGGATGRQPDAMIEPPPAPSASPSARSANAVAVATGVLRSGPTSGQRPNSTRIPDASQAPSPTRTPDLVVRQLSALDPPPQAGPFAITLFQNGDFVAQARVDWCVPASILTMTNMIDLGGDHTTPTQENLDRLARRLSSPRLRGAGSEPEGWAGTLNRLGFGPYEVRAEPTRAAAIATAARALRLTGRPVGLLVWRGAHAWVMSGFRATADPAGTDAFTVTHVYVVDPLYPRDSSIWGSSRPPNTVIRARQLAADYLAWRRPAVRYPEKDGRFVLVVPVVDTPAVQADQPD